MTMPFYIIGLSVRTTNENGQSSSDIPQLWNRFFADSIGARIPGKISNELYCLYTQYEKDHTKPYTTVLGYKVGNLDNIPEGLTGITIAPGNYTTFKATGNLNEGAVFQSWTQIWNSGISRANTTDFEIYGEKAQDPTNAEVAIYVAIPG